MARLSAVTDVIRRLKSRFFPERQLYFRANGVVRYIAVAPHWQMAGVLAALAFLGWVGVASVNLIFKDQIIAAKDRQLEELSQSYEELAGSMQRLQAEVVATTQRLKERQNYFRQIIEDKDGGQDPAPGESGLQETGNSKPLSFGAPSLGGKSLEYELAALENRQRAIAGRLLGLTNTRLMAMESVLSGTGLNKESLLSFETVSGAAAQGGPLQPEDTKLTFDLPASDDVVDMDFMDGGVLAMKKPTLDPFTELLVRQNELRILSQVLQNAPFARPVKNYYISSRFGGRTDPLTRRRAMHSGVDLAGWPKSPVHVTASGHVTKAGRNGAYGNFVEVDHGNGFRTRYGHLRTIKVKAGDRLERGALVGLMGSTGRSTGTHLHYEIWFADRPLNPLKFFEAADDVRKIQNAPAAISS